MKPIYSLMAIACLSFSTLSACQSEKTQAYSHPIISVYSQGWNDKDLETMASLMHPDITWMSVEGDTIKVEVSGKVALVAEMKNWFEGESALPRGSLRDWSVNGNYVAVTETASWTAKDGSEKSQSALSVYELEDDLIRRVYYYPST